MRSAYAPAADDRGVRPLLCALLLLALAAPAAPAATHLPPGGAVLHGVA
jgi:hypothetical protein